MEGKNSEKTSSNYRIFEILMKDYEEDMKSLPKEKKEAILDIFKNHNQLKCKTELDDIKYKLHNVCQAGDLDYIKILLGKTIENDSKDMTFKIVESNKTAALTKVSKNLEHIFIPRTVKYENTDYLITSILSFGFSITDTNIKIKTIKFAEDSVVRTFYEGAFAFSKVEEIYFPKNLTELKKGWCNITSQLTKIIISPSNDRFIFKDDKYLLGKSDNKSDEFDVLLFVRRDLNEISLPSNIKIIGSGSFYNSQINRILIPANVTKIEEYAFFYCRNMQCVEFQENSNLQIIGENAFANSVLNQISIPSSVSYIGQNAFCNCKRLEKVVLPKNSNLQIIEKKVFSYSYIQEIFIPASVTKICEEAFSDCGKLSKIEIPTNSKLQTIESGAFIWTSINEIYFPDSLIELNDYWCSLIFKLNKIIISPSNNRFIFKDDKYLLGKSDIDSDEFDILLFVRRDVNEISIPSNIKIIGSNSFSGLKIEQISIPPSVTKICSNAFTGCNELTKVEFPTDSNLQIIEKNSFTLTKITEMSIPSSVSKICEGAFSQCYKLTKFVFNENEKIDTIEKDLFNESTILEISIPSSVTKICENSFNNCHNLGKIEIPTNSNLKTIESEALKSTGIKEIYFPKTLIDLKERWCYDVNYLTKIIISPSNDRFVFKDKKYLLGKSDNNSNEFDILLFVRRDIYMISLPSNIKIIGSCSFHNARIDKISIPKSVTKICQDAFCKSNLVNLKIPNDSNLQIIDEYAFQSSKIKQFCFPPSISEIGEFSFSYCNELQIVEIPENNKIKSIPKTAFLSSNFIMMVPSSLGKLIREENIYYNFS